MNTRIVVTVALACLTIVPVSAGEMDMWQFPEELTPLTLDVAGTNGWSAAPASLEPAFGIAYPGEKWVVNLQLTGVDADVKPTIEVVRFGTRHDLLNPLQADLVLVNRSDVVVCGKPLRVETKIENNTLRWEGGGNDLAELGCYAVIVEIPGKGRQVGATVARVLPTSQRGTGKDSMLFYHLHHVVPQQQLEMVTRLGYRWIRTDGMPNWNSAAGRGDDPLNWDHLDKWVETFRKNGLYIQSNMYGAPGDTITKPNWDTYNYVFEEKWDSKWGDFVEEAVRRYCGPDGDGPLQIIDYWNEPWEGGGISAWKSDSFRYRALYKTLYERAKKGSPHILVGGSSSIMNTVDKFFSQADWDKQWTLDILTDHYVQPSASYGPLVGMKLGVPSIETETWLGSTQDALLETITHFLASGQKIINPNHPSQLMWRRGDGTLMCRPTITAASFFLNFTAGYKFQRIVFHDHLPWLYEFGDGKTSVFALAGCRSIIDAGFGSMYDQMGSPRGLTHGTLMLDSLGGKLVARDMDGNPLPADKDGKYTLPLTNETFYLDGGKDLTAQQVIDAVKAARMDGIKPVEFSVDDFATPIDQAKALEFDVHNVLNREILGMVEVVAPKGVKLKDGSLTMLRRTGEGAATDDGEPVMEVMKLKAGETLRVAWPIESATPNDTNAYEFKFTFSIKVPETGEIKKAAEWTEVIHANVIRKSTPKIDGDLADWADVPGVIVHSADLKRDITAAAWKPWEKEAETPTGLAEIKFKYDDKFIYVAVRERNKAWKPKPRLSVRDDDTYFGKDDMAHTYVKGIGEALPYTGDVLQIGFNLGLPGVLPANPAIPARMAAREDTNYEYAVWQGSDGQPEIWRSQTPDMWPFNFLPRCMPAGYDGVPKGAQVVVKRVGDDTIYEIAIPLADMKELTPKPGESIRIAVALQGIKVFTGMNRSRCTANGLTFKPTWQRSPSNDIRWGFVE